MLKFNILMWADEKISILKEKGVVFENEIPQLSSEHIYKGVPVEVSTFTYRNDISAENASMSVLTYYMYEKRLWPRLYKIDADIEILRKYGGVVGFDLSPSVGMLRPRQRFSILVNAIYSCYLGINGIKVIPNYRAGDLGTICAADYFPDDCSFMIGNLGCSNNGYKAFGEYQLDIVLYKKHPPILYIYGSISKKEAARLIGKHGFTIISFPDRRNRVRNNSKSYQYYRDGDSIYKIPYGTSMKGGAA